MTEILRLANEEYQMVGSAPDTILGTVWQTVRQTLDRGTIGEVNSFTHSANRNNNILLSAIAFLRKPGCGVLHDPFALYHIFVREFKNLLLNAIAA